MLTKSKFLEIMSHGVIILTSTFSGRIYNVVQCENEEAYFKIMLDGSHTKKVYDTDSIVNAINDQFFSLQFI